MHVAREQGVPLELAQATENVNQRQKGIVLRKLRQQFDGDLRGRKVAMWGLAFKPRTDDIRESAALTVVDGLIAEGARVTAHDPEAGEAARRRFGATIEVVDEPYGAVERAHALVLMTEWRQYQNPDFARIKEAMAEPVLLDARNIWSTYGLSRQGFRYLGIGVPSS